MTDTILALLRACHDEPDCDLPRLLLADALDEAGEPERAELVRVQCRIAEGPWAKHDTKLIALRHWQEEWIVKRHGGGDWFIDAANMSITSGETGIEYRYVRGLLHVAAPLADLEAGLRRMGPEAWWVATCRASNFEPSEREDRRPRRFWWMRGDSNDPRFSQLEESLFDLLTGGIREDADDVPDENGLYMAYPTPDLAHADLSRAILATVREPGRVTAITKGG